MTTENFATPKGRLVQGSVSKGNTKDYEGKLLTFKDGTPRTEWYIGLAIHKNDPGWPIVHKALVTEAQTSFPNYFNPDGSPKGAFSWKITDGDSQKVDSRGKRLCDREGFSGHWILGLKSSFAPSIVGQNNLPIDAIAVKRGFYVRVSMGAKGNGRTGDQMGLFLNFNMVQLIEAGPIILSGPSADDVFGPASSTPGITPAPGVPGATPAPGAPVPGTMPPPNAAPGTHLEPPPGVTPAPNFLHPTPAPGTPGATPAPGAPGATPAPSVTPAPARTMLDKAGNNTYENFTALGWTDEQLISEGYMLPGNDVPV